VSPKPCALSCEPLAPAKASKPKSKSSTNTPLY
jgi:hypothetical protein